MRADRKKVEPLLRTARGQLDGVLKMIEDDRYCMEIVTQLQAVESLVHKAQREVLRAHLSGCVQDAFETGDEQAREGKIDEIIKLLDKTWPRACPRRWSWYPMQQRCSPAASGRSGWPRGCTSAARTCPARGLRGCGCTACCSRAAA